MAFENNRYCVNLPFTNHSEVLPDNFNVARSRLTSLKRKLNSNPTLLHEYDQIMKDYLKDNIIEEANGNKVVTSAHYLPHHAEIKSGRESTKTRIVFDALAKSDKNEPSLNDILYNGPCLLPLIEDVLLKFRLGRIGVVADMQQAFLQISVNECHRNYLRFLWYNNIFDENILKVYRFGRVLFGPTCSPFLLNGTVKVHIEKHVNHDTRAVLETFLRNLYVDDTAKSFNSIADASKFYRITSSVMSKGGFNLRKWDSNDETVKRLICNDNSKFMKGNKIRKVLGINWNIFHDKPELEISDLAKIALELPATKRNILKILAIFYDPLGLVSPIVLQSKLIYHSLCKEKINWDIIVPESIRNVWDKFVETLRHSEKIVISRPLFNIYDESCFYEVHGFADASSEA